MQSVCKRSFRAAANDVLTAVGGTANAGKLRVTQSLVPPTLTSVLADFTAAIASYSGYAEVSQTYAASGSMNDAVTRAKGLASRFFITGGTTYQTLYNLYLTNSAGNLLIGAGTFLDPPVLGNPTAACWPTPNLPWGPPSANPPFGIDLLITAHVQRLHLDLLTAALGLLEDANVRLLQATVNLGQDTTLAECVAAEADYSGYASQPVAAWLAAYVGDSGYAQVNASGLLFQPNATTVPNDIYGWFVTNAADDTLLYAAMLDEPVVLDSPDSGLIVEAPLTWGT